MHKFVCKRYLEEIGHSDENKDHSQCVHILFCTKKWGKMGELLHTIERKCILIFMHTNVSLVLDFLGTGGVFIVYISHKDKTKSFKVF